MRKELVKNLKARLRKNPAATIVEVSQNDARGNCQCSKCWAIDKEEGSPSHSFSAGSLYRFINAVAADIEEEFGPIPILTHAHAHTQKPPTKLRPRHNVIPWLSGIRCSFSRPLSDEGNTQEFRDDIIGWSKISNHDQ